MPLDHEALAEMVVQTVEAALAPLLHRLDSAETLLKSFGDVRDRVIAVEVKASHAAEGPVASVRDRVLALETKLAGPSPADVLLSDIKARFDAIEALPPGADPAAVTALRDRVVVLETTLPELRKQLDAMAAAVDRQAMTLDGKSAAIQRDLSVFGERVASVEARAPIPGPPGAPGKDGHDGVDGKDGLGFDDISVVQDGDRDLVVRGTRGDRVKELGRLTFPVQINRGVYQEGRKYCSGDVVSWGGGQWYCSEDTVSKPVEGAKSWTVVVKRGRDGKDGKDAPGALPVVRAGG